MEFWSNNISIEPMLALSFGIWKLVVLRRAYAS